jgi:hypothetical protein
MTDMREALAQLEAAQARAAALVTAIRESRRFRVARAALEEKKK